MASAVVDRVWRDAAPDALEQTLAELWREVGRRATVARAVMSNLVVLRACRADEPTDAFAGTYGDTIDAIIARHPSRVIVIAHETGCPLARAPIAARGGIVTNGPPQASYAVEHVSVRSSCGESSLPSIVRRLVRGDLPTSIWCPEDVSRQPPLRAIVAEARQLIYDSRAWSDLRGGIRAIEQSTQGFQVDVADVNWRRLTPIRDAVRHSTEHLAIDALRSGQVRIAHAPGEEAMAWLLAGWLAARLGWGEAAIRVDETHDPDARLTLTVGAGADASLLELGEQQVRVAPRGAAPYVSVVRQESAPDAIAAELRSLSADSALRDTLRALARLTSAASA